MSDTASSPTSIADFERSLGELEELVRRLEQGEMSLEQSLTAFERGISLTRQCQQTLRAAEQRVQQLTRLPDGSAELRPFGISDEGGA